MREWDVIRTVVEVEEDLLYFVNLGSEKGPMGGSS